MGAIEYVILDADTGRPMPGRITLVGVAGTPEPSFTEGDLGRQEGHAVGAYNRIMSISGDGTYHVPYGTYDIYVSRGPEWELAQFRAVQVGGAPVQVRARLRRVVPTEGWLSADFHVHSACSPDSRVPMRDRVYEFVSDSIDYIVATDHNVVCDYAPYIAMAGAGSLLASSTGDEVTTAGWGHFGLFPMPVSPAGPGGAPLMGRDAEELFRLARQRFPGSLLSVNHPRIDNQIGYFNLGRYDARQDQAGRPGFSLNFDAMEVLNGYQDAERRNIDRVIDDWFALLNHGHLVTGTGNSDSHHLNLNIGGYPRNYVMLPDDRPVAVRAADVVRAVRARHVQFTTAPFVRMQVDGGHIGDLVRVARGRAQLFLEVYAAPWVSVSRVILYLNGQEAQRIAVARSNEALRLRLKLPLTLTRDTFVVARVDGDQPLAPVVGDTRRFDVRPFAMTNPVYLDVDGNGVFNALAAPAPPKSPPQRGK